MAETDNLSINSRIEAFIKHAEQDKQETLKNLSRKPDEELKHISLFSPDEDDKTGAAFILSLRSCLTEQDLKELQEEDFNTANFLLNTGSGLMTPITSILENKTASIAAFAVITALCIKFPFIAAVLPYIGGAYGSAQLGTGLGIAAASYKNGRYKEAEEAGRQIGSGISQMFLSAHSAKPETGGVELRKITQAQEILRKALNSFNYIDDAASGINSAVNYLNTGRDEKTADSSEN